jgi:hemoglobin
MFTDLIIVAIVLIAAYFVYQMYYQKPREKTLYERLGGIFAIAAVVDHFSDAIINNPVAGKDSKNPFLRDWHTNQLSRLPGLKFMRTLWVAQATGGPYKFVASSTGSGGCPFSSLNLTSQHKQLKITSEEFDAVAGELAKSLDHFKVPEKEKNEVLGAFAAHKEEVIAGSLAK